MTIEVPTQIIRPSFIISRIPRVMKHNTKITGTLPVRTITERECQDYTNEPSKLITATSDYRYSAIKA